MSNAEILMGQIHALESKITALEENAMDPNTAAMDIGTQLQAEINMYKRKKERLEQIYVNKYEGEFGHAEGTRRKGTRRKGTGRKGTGRKGTGRKGKSKGRKGTGRKGTGRKGTGKRRK